jgi:hypothetical protein
MKTTTYFEEQVLRKRPYIVHVSCSDRRAVAPRGSRKRRIRHWGEVVDARDGKERILPVVTLEDGETIHNAFFDRDFRKDKP